MRKRNTLGLIVALFALLFLSSCEYDTIETEIIPIDDTISFAQEIQPIFSSKCVECHNGSRNPDLREGNAYNSLTTGGYINTDDPESSKIYEVITGFHANIPSSTEKQKILVWIKQGALDN